MLVASASGRPSASVSRVQARCAQVMAAADTRGVHVRVYRQPDDFAPHRVAAEALTQLAAIPEPDRIRLSQKYAKALAQLGAAS